MNHSIVMASLCIALAGCNSGPDEPSHRTVAVAPSQLRDLATELEDRNVSLISIRGNGSSTGAAITGTLVNHHRTEVRIATDIARSLYLANAGPRQNMLAFEVYLRDGSYYRDGSRSFITLGSGESTPVMFIALCADFERDNPQASDEFTVGTAPVELASLASRISQYFLSDRATTEDVTALQVALWIGQGVEPSDIRRTFEFTPEDLELAYEILQGAS